MSKISVVVFNDVGEEDEKGEPSEEEEAEDEEGEEDDLLEHTIISQRCNLTDGEKQHLLQLLPLTNMVRVGMPYVTRLNAMNFERHNMVRFVKLPMFFFLCPCLLGKLSGMKLYFFLSSYFISKNYL